jgi:hypothetical protein
MLYLHAHSVCAVQELLAMRACALCGMSARIGISSCNLCMRLWWCASKHRVTLWCITAQLTTMSHCACTNTYHHCCYYCCYCCSATLLQQLANIYVTVTAGSIFKAVEAILRKPDTVLGLLGGALPLVAVYFTNLIIVKVNMLHTLNTYIILVYPASR